MDESSPTTHRLGSILLFSFLGGLFGASVVLLLSLYGYAMGWMEYPQLVDQLTRPVVEGFLTTFLLTLYWLLGSYVSERMGGRVGVWQALPRWFRTRTTSTRDRAPDGSQKTPQERAKGKPKA